MPIQEVKHIRIRQLQDPNPEINRIILPDAYIQTDRIFHDVYQPGAEIDRAKMESTYIPMNNLVIRNLIESSFQEMYQLDLIARNVGSAKLTKEQAENITHIIRFSNPGTYFEPVKNDKYRQFLWAWNMDRFADDAAFLLSLRILNLKQGLDFSQFNGQKIITDLDQDFNALRPTIREALINSGIRFMYMGRRARPKEGITDDETKAIIKVLESKSSFVPREIVDVRKRGIDDTYTQVVDLRKYLKAEKISDGKTIMIVCYAPHAVRIAHMCQQIGATPEGVNVIFNVLPTPTSGIDTFVPMEVKGIVKYALTGKAALTSITYSAISAYE